MLCLSVPSQFSHMLLYNAHQVGTHGCERAEQERLPERQMLCKLVMVQPARLIEGVGPYALRNHLQAVFIRVVSRSS